MSSHERNLDIFFISYDESCADRHWLWLKKLQPHAQRIHGVRGIWRAYGKAARLAQSDYFFAVDADNVVLPEFDFSVEELDLAADKVHVWRCRNLANQLIYGYGAIKLFHRRIQEITPNTVDLTTGLAQRYQVVPTLASETFFFNTPFEAWRGAFRESSKLHSGQLKNQNSKETEQRLKQWPQIAENVKNRQWILRGFEDGRHLASRENVDLQSINRESFLRESFRIAEGELQNDQ